MTDAHEFIDEPGPDEPVFHIRSYGDVSRRQLDYFWKHSTLEGFPNWPPLKQVIDAAQGDRTMHTYDADLVVLPSVDEFAQQLRMLNGNNKMGAAMLAERLLDWLRTRATASAHPGVEDLMNAKETTLTIWKFPIELFERQEIRMPAGAQLLDVRLQFDVPVLWALVDPGAEMVSRSIFTAGTGMQTSPGGRYVGTFQMHGGGLVFHVFDEKPVA